MATTPIPATLTLGAQYVLTDPEDRMRKIFQNTVYGMTRDLEIFGVLKVSLPELITAFSNSPSLLTNEIKRQYQDLYYRAFPTATFIDVSATTSSVTSTQYSLIISIQIIDQGVAMSLGPKLSVNGGFLQMSNDVINLSVSTNTIT